MKAIMLIALSVFSLTAMAQEKKDKKAKWDKSKYHMPAIMTRGIGITFQDFNRLNNRMAGFTQYNPQKNRMWTLSMGSMQVQKNFVSQFTVTGGSSLTGNPNKKSSTLRTLGAGIDLGYDVIPSKNIMVYPMVGLGAETFQAVYFKDVNAVDFDAVANSSTVQNNIRKTKFTNSFFTYRLGLGMSVKSPKDDGSIGLQVGYVSGFQEERWKSAEFQNLNNAPRDGLHRFAVTLVFTGGMMGIGK
ncbi:MAG: hypothetical protein IPL54_00815 [Chitinophagaceae bacterium]|nr:hypothetical protein [Chitinophagaceae bacterium]